MLRRLPSFYRRPGRRAGCAARAPRAIRIFPRMRMAAQKQADVIWRPGLVRGAALLWRGLPQQRMIWACTLREVWWAVLGLPVIPPPARPRPAAFEIASVYNAPCHCGRLRTGFTNAQINQQVMTMVVARH